MWLAVRMLLDAAHGQTAEREVLQTEQNSPHRAEVFQLQLVMQGAS